MSALASAKSTQDRFALVLITHACTFVLHPYRPHTEYLRITHPFRWERADRYGLQPPVEVKAILDKLPTNSVHDRNLWTGRVWVSWIANTSNQLDRYVLMIPPFDWSPCNRDARLTYLLFLWWNLVHNWWGRNVEQGTPQLHHRYAIYTRGLLGQFYLYMATSRAVRPLDSGDRGVFIIGSVYM